MATDVSPEALELARENAGGLGLGIELVETNLLDGLAGQFDLVVSNPPYVRQDEIDALEPEVRDWEPRLAVVGDQTPELAADARARLAPSGALVLESHAEHASDVAALLQGLGYADVTVTRDLAGRERVVEARWT
jgi:release factor glutamine methyltransferase